MATRDVDRTLGDLAEEPGGLETDRVWVRVLREDDTEAVARIDEVYTGRQRRSFFRRKIAAAVRDPGVQLSLAAELDHRVVGYLLASVDYGDFGVPEPVAVLDAIAVDPDAGRRHVASALFRQLALNLRALRIDRVRTEVDWRQAELMRFLERRGFAPAPRLCLEAAVERLPLE